MPLWRCLLIAAGLDRAKPVPRYWPPKILQAAVPMCRGLVGFDEHSRLGGRPMVYFHEVEYSRDGQEGLFAVASIDVTLDAVLRTSGGDFPGLSMSVDGRTEPRDDFLLVTKILRVRSCDIVDRPIAGGRFIRPLGDFEEGRAACSSAEMDSGDELLAARSPSAPRSGD